MDGWVRFTTVDGVRAGTPLRFAWRWSDRDARLRFQAVIPDARWIREVTTDQLDHPETAPWK